MTPPVQPERYEEAGKLLRLAERDAIAFNVLQTVAEVHPTIACFHAQQAVEKALKAALLISGGELRKTHDVQELVYQLLEIFDLLPFTPEQVGKLNPYAVTFRYDDMDIEVLSLPDAENLMWSVVSWSRRLIEQNGRLETVL